MDLGYIKVGAISNQIKVADVKFNLNSIKEGIDLAVREKVKVLVFPELCLTGSTLGDLFYSKTLLDRAKSALLEVAKYTKDKNLLVFVGLPIQVDGLIYNAVAGICDGTVLGIVPKTYMSDYLPNNQKRYFASAPEKLSCVNLSSDITDIVPFGKNIIFADSELGLKVCAQIGQDIDAIVPSCVYHAVKGANLIVNPFAESEFSGVNTAREFNAKAISEKLCSAYVYINSSDGESTTDSVFSATAFITENGKVLNKNKPFDSGLIMADVDLGAIEFERSKKFNLNLEKSQQEIHLVGFSLNNDGYSTDRTYDKTPFIKVGEEDLLIDIAAHALKKRISHVNASKVVIGISGGLDSTLALIIAVRSMQLLGRSTKDIVSITMPCFGTSSRTFDNSVSLAKVFNTTLKKIDITKSVKRHLKDIEHPIDLHDAAYENAQARERTQVLMDYANSVNGIVVGTGDLSELALGWATYNGDHMSMYAVNGSIPKTLVRHLVGYTANKGKGKFKAVLLDILDTPVSPELIPSGNDTIKQVTEDIVGPYVLHDFFLYLMVKRGFTPLKIYRVAVNTFKGEFDEQTILKWLKTFIRRFFTQQFKRSCLPDGVQVTEISLSPRGSWRMPSDAVFTLWMEELERLN
ncbi:MAG: NAD(+) synthase [Clostridia bacterium]|nr:NAD(+) synthase [Clostridia bacterium]